MTIPVAIAYSPKTQTSGVTAIGATVIVIDNTVNEGIDSFPDASVDAPGEATLCVVEHFSSEDPADYETIRYTERHVGSNELRGVTRGVEGTAREWPAGTWIASYTSAAAWNETRGDVVASTTHTTEAEIHRPIYDDPLPEPSGYAEGDVVITPQHEDNITITVGSGQDFATINEAIEYIEKYRPTRNIRASIVLSSGFVMAEQVLVENRDLGYITITSVDAEVTITRSALTTELESTRYPAFGATNNGTLPVIGALFTMDSSGTATNRYGVLCWGNSRARILSGCGVKNAGSHGLICFYGCWVDAFGANFSGAAGACIYALNSSWINAHIAVATGGGTFGIRAVAGSHINAHAANARRGETDDPTDIDVATGATINANGVTGGLSQTKNTGTGNGIIFQV